MEIKLHLSFSSHFASLNHHHIIDFKHQNSFIKARWKTYYYASTNIDTYKLLAACKKKKLNVTLKEHKMQGYVA